MVFAAWFETARPWRRRRLAAALLTVSALFSGAAQDGVWAQETGATEASVSGETAELRRQQALFDAMLADPTDAQKALDYARYSAKIEDFEAAISTLERILAASNGAPALEQRLRLELAAIYFRLGSYAVASAYLRDARQGPPLSGDASRRARLLEEQISRRTQRHRFDGFVDLGAIASDNVTFGSDADTYSPFGVAVSLNGAADAEEDVGVRGRFALRHRYNPGAPDGDIWRTDISGVTRNYFEETDASVHAASLRTGPELSLDEFRYGPKLRPFVGGNVILRDDELSSFTGLVGARASVALSDEWSGAGELGVGRRWVERGSRADERDAAYVRGLFDAAYAPTRRLVFRGRALAEREIAEADAFSFSGAQLRASGRWSYGAGLAGVDRLWAVEAFATAGWRTYDEADRRIDPDRREDVTGQVGLSHSAFVTNDLSLVLDVRRSLRRSSVDVYDFDATRVGASVRFTF